MKRRMKVNCSWSARLAYAIGVIATDGNLSPSGRHIIIVSKDYQMIATLKHLLELNNKIGKKARGGSRDKKYYVLQFGDIHFYEFLVSIGLSQAKSKTLGKIIVPKEYFSHFLRGCFDGDGSITGFTHPESSLFQTRTSICSASPKFLLWLKESIQTHLGISGGWISSSKNTSAQLLQYGKRDSLIFLESIYKNKEEFYLKRKYKTAQKYAENV